MQWLFGLGWSESQFKKLSKPFFGNVLYLPLLNLSKKIQNWGYKKSTGSVLICNLNQGIIVAKNTFNCPNPSCIPYLIVFISWVDSFYSTAHSCHRYFLYAVFLIWNIVFKFLMRLFSFFEPCKKYSTSLPKSQIKNQCVCVNVNL